MYVPDPGLAAKLYFLLKNSGEIYMDSLICCMDGSFQWSSLLLAVSSQHLKVVFNNCSGDWEPILMLPDFKWKFVLQVFNKLIELGNLEFDNRELELLSVLGVYNKETSEERRKTVHILSSSSSKSILKYDEGNHSRSIISLNQGDENDVDIIFENDDESEESEMEDNPQENLPDLYMNQTIKTEDVGIDDKIAEVQTEGLLDWNPGFTKSKNYAGTLSTLILQEVESSHKETEGSKESHRDQIQTKKLYNCRKCKTRFNFLELKQHREKFPDHFNKNSGSELFCRFCNKDFKLSGMMGFREHIASHKDQDGKFSCPKCEKSNDTWGHLIQHMFAHGGKRPYRCSYCSYDSINKSNVLKHEKAKHEDPDKRDFCCNVCSKKFKNSCHLSTHMKIHKTNKFSCEVCSKVFKSDLGLIQHKRFHTGEMIPCQVCSVSFLSVHSTKRHEKDIHSYYRDKIGDKKFLCKLGSCDIAFSTEDDKKVHFLENHSVERSSFICNICSLAFPSKNILRFHKKRFHQGMKARRLGMSLLRPEEETSERIATHPRSKDNRSLGVIKNEAESPEFKCNCCHKTFQYEYLMLSHCIINKSKGFLCSYDGCPNLTKPLPSQVELYAHMLKHTGERVFKCTYCQQGFSKENLLKRHESTHNLIQPQYLCPFQDCGRIFTTVITFDEHIEEHDPEHNRTKFYCYVCKKELNSKESKDEHIVSMHPALLMSYSCSHCGQSQPSQLVHRMHEKYCKNNKSVEENWPVFTCSHCSQGLCSMAGKILHEKHCSRKRVSVAEELTVEQSVEETQVQIFSGQQEDINRYFYDICKICKKIFVNFGEYVEHLQDEHSSDSADTELECNICGKTVLLHQLQEHLSLFHFLGDIFRCEDCSSTFNKLQDLERHNDTYHAASDQYLWVEELARFICNFCGKHFKTKTGISKHVQSQHSQQENSTQKQELQIFLEEGTVGSEGKVLVLRTETDEEHQIILENQLMNQASAYVNMPSKFQSGRMLFQSSRIIGSPSCVHQDEKMMTDELDDSTELEDDNGDLVNMLDVVVEEEEYTENVVIKVERNEANGNFVATLIPQ